MNNEEFYDYILSLPSIKKAHEIRYMWDLWSKGEPTPFMNSEFYPQLMDCVSVGDFFNKELSVFEIIDLISNGATDEEIEALMVMNKLTE